METFCIAATTWAGCLLTIFWAIATAATLDGELPASGTQAAAIQTALLHAYESWWSKVKDLAPDEAARMDPLEGTQLSGY